MRKIIPLLIFILSTVTPSIHAQLSWQWGVRGNDFGPNTSSHNDDVIDMAADPDGNVYVLTTAYLHGDVNGVPVTGIANPLNTIESIVISSYDCNGDYRWHKIIGGTAGNNVGVAIKTDTLGGVYVTGQALAYAFYPDQNLFPDSLHIDTDYESASTNKSMFIVKYDTSGIFQWLRMPQPDTANYVTSFAHGSRDMDVSPGGDVFVYSLLAPGAYENGAFVVQTKGMYIIVYDKNGVFQELIPLDITVGNGGNPNNMGGFGNPRGAHFKRDHNSGRFYLTGIFWGYIGSMSVGSTPLEYSGGYAQKLYVASFNSSGDALWLRQATPADTGTFGSSSNTRSRVATDNEGNVFVAGFAFTGDSWYGHVFSNTLNTTVIFLLKMDADGNTEWITSPAVEAGEAQQVVYANGIVAVGGLYGHMIWDNFEVANEPGYGREVFLARFNSGTGAVLSLDTIASTIYAQEWLTAMTADRNGNFSIGGQFTDQLFVPGSTLTTAYYEDWFVAKLGTGNCLCTTAIPDFTHTSGGGNTLMFTYTGTTPVDSVVWEFGDGSSAAGSNVTHTYGSPGSYTICASAYNSCGMSLHCETVNTSVLGVEHMPGFADIRVYPNPATEDITIEHAAPRTKMEIYSLLGSVLLSADLQGFKNTVALGQLAPGIYMIRFTDKMQRQGSLRFVKQ